MLLASRFQVELYCDVFQNLGETTRVVSAENGGLVLVMDRQTVAVLTGSGQQLAAWKWNNPPLVIIYSVLLVMDRSFVISNCHLIKSLTS
jgi:hypothetical protein